MTTIKANCEHCTGEIEMGPAAFLVTTYKHTGVGYYEFFCDKCHRSNRKEADEHIVALLRSGGVRQAVITVPAEALEPKGGPAINYDDVMDFILEMEQHNNALCAALAKGRMTA